MLADRAYWLTYKGKEMLYCDYKSLSDDEIIELIKHIEHLILNSGKNQILKVNDVRGLFVSAEVLAEIKRSSKILKPYLKKSAYVGITGAKKFLLEVVNYVSSGNAKPFVERDEALDWIAGD
ncbi:MAG: STAS/SEC14 domain-containing protein [Bacteroidales bacterium]|nr:STAS/SEC14 domain-containing protein [Bacteroidales bacterium]